MPRRTAIWALPIHTQGKLDEAIACYRKSVALKPDNAGERGNLGLALQGPGQAGRESHAPCLPPGRWS